MLAVPLPVMILLSALLLMVVPLIVAKLKLPDPSVLSTCPALPSVVGSVYTLAPLAVCAS